MLTKYLIKNGIILDPIGNKKWHILENLTHYYCKDIPPKIADQIFETVLSREIKVSTGLGGGVAIPHARTNLVDRTGVLFARFKEGIEWDSMDGALVHFLFLVIGPVTSAEKYLQVLASISKMLSRKYNRSALMEATSSAEIISVMENVEDRRVERSPA